ncbi:hypothetical protein LWC08_00350 [Desulfobaculum bizertense]|nr:hypothetical protein [Desulfobaculum bizertense]UIJ39507.1 hypothetical protein LWC08_00350 [Desulfobaculum bizertense]
MILAWGVESYVSLLNLRALHPELPREFSDTFDAASYAKSQEYTRIGSRFGLIASSVELVVLLAFIFLGGFPVVDSIAKSFGFGNIITGLFFFAILSLLDGIVGLPFSICMGDSHRGQPRPAVPHAQVHPAAFQQLYAAARRTASHRHSRLCRVRWFPCQ